MVWPGMAARVTALLVAPLAPATMVARVTALLVMLSLAPAVLLLLLSLPVLVLAGTRARRLELRHEASGLVRGQLPRLQGAVAAAEARPRRALRRVAARCSAPAEAWRSASGRLLAPAAG